MAHERVELGAMRLDLRPFERRPEEVLLKKDVLDRQLINVDGARLVRTNEIELARVDGWYRVVGVDTGLRGLTRRVLPRRLAPAGATPGSFLDWASVEPFTGHVPTVRLRVPHPKLARLHPAQLADLVEAASHREGEEIMSRAGRRRGAGGRRVRGARPAAPARVHRGTLATRRSRPCWRGWSPTTPSTCWASSRRSAATRIVALLPALQARRVRALAGYDPATAGGLMSPDFICLYSTATKAEALTRIRRGRVNAGSITSISR